tara:strand:+ start:807 stop:1196 length:390 start_codon:yes stop_codon:yes gene_type:complete
MILIKPIYSNEWVRIISIAFIEKWLESQSKFEICPQCIAGLESNMAIKLRELPPLISFSVSAFSIITRFYCSIRFRSIGFRKKQDRKLILKWFMKSNNTLITNYRLFIEKFTILYIMDQIEKSQSSKHL